MKYDWLIIGCGFTGCVIAERLASKHNKKIMIVDRRNHIAGNAYDYVNNSGVLVHKYGPHIFHTNSKRVWDYLSRFTNWNYYEHRVLANIEGELAPIPFNLNTIYQLFPQKKAEQFEKLLIDEFGYGKKIPILKLKEHASGELSFLADYIYDHVFRGYTSKQWGLSPEELDFSVTARIPVYISRDNRYFQDTYQGIPRKGYTEMFKKIIDHPNIEVKLKTDGLVAKNDIDHEKLLYTGPIDSFFEYKHGELPYRSLKFEHRTYDSFPYQKVAQVNYPNNYDFTRITEFGHLNEQTDGKTTIAVEHPQPHINGETEPYYPIPKDEYQERYQLYKEETKKLVGKVFFAGRLADYKYYNMDQVVARALNIYKSEIIPSII